MCLDTKSSIPHVESIFLDEDDMVNTSNLQAEIMYKSWLILVTECVPSDIISLLTFLRMYGASTLSLHLLSTMWIAPSSLLYSDSMSLPRKTGSNLQVGNLLSYA